LIRRLAVLSCLLVSSVLTAAAAAVDGYPGLYAEVQVGANAVTHSERDFISPVASVIGGVWVYTGIGIEAFADAELARGADGGFEAGVSNAFGAALRLSSPPSGGLRGYVVLGYVDFTLAQEPTRGIGREIDERFSGVRFGVGLQQRLQRFPSVLFGAEYRNFHTEEAVQVDGLVFGLRLDVR